MQKTANGSVLNSLETFIKAYVECALWLAQDENGEARGLNELGYDISDFNAQSQQSIRDDCHDFFAAHSFDLDSVGDYAQHGHDFYLSRNGHGAGFFDRGYGAVGDRLQAAARVYGESDVYFGDDGRLYVQ